jgi:type IV pilus assembly protein PilE
MKPNQRGVTLIELLVVMAIVGIITAIAVPSYRMYVIRANRSDAKTWLMQTSQLLERCYTNSTPYAYNSATCTAAVTLPFDTPQGTYRISALVGPNPQAYTLQAIPLAGQAVDTQCANFQLDQTGLRSVTGTTTAQECWRR